MNTQNPAQSADPSPVDERVQPDGPLSGEVQRGGNRMPRPWFRATTRNFCIESVLYDSWSSRRTAPLGPQERELGWLVLPDFQRPAVWTEEQQSRFVESAWMGMPLGTWAFNRSEGDRSPFDNWLLDGQQRVTAIRAYVADDFPVLGFNWSDLDLAEQRRFHMIPFTALETSLDDRDALHEIYRRLAYGGTPHAPENVPATPMVSSTGEGK